MKAAASGLIAGLVLVGLSGAARADVAAVFAEGQGSVGNGGDAAKPSEMGLGYRLGARLLVFEGYFDYTGFGDGAAVSRGILGLRGGFGSNDLRLVLRAGGGVIEEAGGALTGRVPGVVDRRGAVGRIGAALETRLSRVFLFGFGVDAEEFAFPATGAYPALPNTGTDVFANLHLTFELGL